MVCVCVCVCVCSFFFFFLLRHFGMSRDAICFAKRAASLLQTMAVLPVFIKAVINNHMKNNLSLKT